MPVFLDDFIIGQTFYLKVQFRLEKMFFGMIG